MMVIQRARTRVFQFLCIFLVAVGVLSLAQRADAHNTFEESSPSDGEVLSAAPATWIVRFTKPVPLDSASGEIIATSGVRVPLGVPRHVGTDNVIEFDLPADLSGDVTARWRLVGVDGHAIRGRVDFTVVSTAVDAGSPMPTESSAVVDAGAPVEAVLDDDQPVSEPVRTILRLLAYVAVLGLVGVVFSEWYLARGTIDTPLGRRVMIGAALTSGIVAVAQLFVFVDDLRDSVTGFVPALGDSLGITAGGMLAFRTVVAMALLMVTMKRTHSLGAVVALLVMYCVAVAYGGHSRSMAAPWIGVPIDVVHQVAAGVWVGGLVVLVVVVLPHADVESGLVAYDRFGYAAQRAVAVIVVTGVIQTVRLHGSLTTLVTTTHGLVLIGKVVVVGVMLRLGARNHHLLARWSGRGDTRSVPTRYALIRASVVESACAVVVVALTAILVASPLG